MEREKKTGFPFNFHIVTFGLLGSSIGPNWALVVSITRGHRLPIVLLLCARAWGEGRGKTLDTGARFAGRAIIFLKKITMF